jgi:Uma2 family endonuclease
MAIASSSVTGVKSLPVAKIGYVVCLVDRAFCAGVHLLHSCRAEHYMGMPHATERWTADMVRALPDDRNRYEVIDGQLLVTPAPSAAHQRILGALFLRLSKYLEGETWGEVLFSPADISFHEDMLVQPDLFVVPTGLNEPRWRNWSDIRELLLAVEVLSPSTARADRQIKRRLYQQERVGEYWIIDVEASIVERWRPEDDRPEIVTGTLTWQPEPSRAPFELDLPAFFDNVLRSR